MDDIYPTTLSEDDIQHIAKEMFLKHGDNAFAEASKEISVSNSRGDFSRAGSWVLVCQRIRKLQVHDDVEILGDKNVMPSE